MTPYGYMVKNGKLVLNKAELKICRVVVELNKQGDLSASAIAHELERRGIKTRSGGSHWDHSTVINIIKRCKDKILLF